MIIIITITTKSKHLENEFEILVPCIVDNNKCFFCEYHLVFMTIEEIIMSRKKYRNKWKRKCKLLIVFSFSSCRGQKMKNGKLLTPIKGKSSEHLGSPSWRGPSRKS